MRLNSRYVGQVFQTEYRRRDSCTQLHGFAHAVSQFCANVDGIGAAISYQLPAASCQS